MTEGKRAIAQAFSRAAPNYDQASHVQQRVGEQMLALLQAQPGPVERALDIGCGTAALTLALTPHARCITALDLAPGMLQVARSNDRQRRLAAFVCGDAERLPFAPGQFDLVFSSFTLQWCEDLTTALTEIHQVLRPGGRLLLSLPVENTLRELRLSWQRAEQRYQHVNQFLSRAQVREHVERSGFHLLQWQGKLGVAFYDNVRSLTRELKTLGAHQVVSNRNRALTGRKTVFKMMSAYEHFRNHQGLLPASWHYLVMLLQKPDS